ncbi:MAG: bifunctional proline dehydrogenase/L-glutamate gamma-semialdehyde dehydrogenase [Planctomycetota bacterium]
MEQTLDLEQLLTGVDPADDAAAAAIEIARRLLIRSRELQTHQERRQQAELDRMISHPLDKATLIEMTDQAFRAHSPARVADQLTHILDLQGVPRFFTPIEKTMLRGFQSFGSYLPGVAVPLVKEKMRQETANVILPAEESMLREHLAARQSTGLRMNVNFLGEALLGEEEAERRLQHYLHALQMPEIACISVKLSTIYSQVSTIARESTVRAVCDRLELLYRAAARESFTDSSGNTTSKFVYLDMEEYRDLHLTADAFRETLGRSGMENVRAGIALQAYVPDSYDVLRELLDWSAARVAKGAVPVTVRLVKGANMEMERVEASVGGWPQTPYAEKIETDANFKRMLRRLIDAAAQGHVEIGVASHNLFDISLALLWGQRQQTLDRMQFEMLEGMANHQRRALFESAPRMLLYAPACSREDFLNAIGYLIRRLDENTGPDNFLRHTFQLTEDSETWRDLSSDFSESLQRIDSVSSEPRRQQDRRQPPLQPAAADAWESYVNEPDTDWSLPHHSEWASQIVERWQARCDQNALDIPLLIGGNHVDGQTRESRDPSRPESVSCRFDQADESGVDAAIECAAADRDGWRNRSWDDRYPLFRAAAQLMRERRADLIGAMMLDGGKLITEADPELSEAIDFTEFYPLTARSLLNRPDVELTPRGAVAVISPWNFPLAIPCGGVVAALAAGNTVILKPASDTVLPAYEMVRCFWDAGIPKTALQFVPCSGGGAGQRLVSDPRIEAVVLTGGTETAQSMLGLRPGLNLIAETGGKNATIVTALSDRDLAIKHILHSAFSHTGQKCSATSLLLLQHELYEDESFRESLADAARSLRVGSVWDLRSKVGPLIKPPTGVLEQGLKELEPDEEWLVMPRPAAENAQLYSPGIKWNVRPGSFTHRTELFGPVLGAMRFGRLEEAIGIVNETGYGLTSGLESLDDREQQLWKDNIRAGNLYINRPTTGAIVLRQPFGGLGSSGYGPGAKAGGPHYVTPLMRAQSDSLDVHAFAKEVSLRRESMLDQAHDHVNLIGQSNERRYVPLRHLCVRLRGDEPHDAIRISLHAAAAAGCHVTYSMSTHDEPLIALLEESFDRLSAETSNAWRPEWIEESDEALAASIADGRLDRLRVFGSVDSLGRVVVDAARNAFLTLLAEPVVQDAEIELLRYLNEQSVSHDYHRYGNLGRRRVGSVPSDTSSSHDQTD